MESSSIHVPVEEFIFTASRASGAGGQNVNKVNSKVTLRWSPGMSVHLPEGVKFRFLQKYKTKINRNGILLITSEKHRDQAKNRQDCIRKIAEMIAAVSEPPKTRKKTKPTTNSVLKRIVAKKKKGEHKKLRGKVSVD